MIEQNQWSMNEDLPKAFVTWLKDRILEQWLKQKKGVVQIADEMSVQPSLLGRWMGGKGPLKQDDIRALVHYYGLVVYTLLGIERLDNQNQIE